MKILIDTLLREALARLPDSLVPAAARGVGIELERTHDRRHGDFASNLALRLAKAANRPSHEMAHALLAVLPTDPALARTEIAGAGFINFFLRDDARLPGIGCILAQDADYGRSAPGAGRAVRLEFAPTSAAGSPTDQVRQAAYGDAVANLLEATGWRVTRPPTPFDTDRRSDTPPAGAEAGAGAGTSAGAETACRETLRVQGLFLHRGARFPRTGAAAPDTLSPAMLRAEVGDDAVRLFCLLRSHERPLHFDLDLAQARGNHNPLFCIQYAHARVASLRQEMRERALHFDAARGGAALDRLTTPHELRLGERLSQFPEIVQAGAARRAPHLLAQYLLKLAREFHAYHIEQPLFGPDIALRDARLCLAFAVQIVVRNGLRLLGVHAPDSL